jgi:transposase
MKRHLCLTSIMLCLCESIFVQGSNTTFKKTADFSNRLFSKIKNKATSLNEGLAKQTEKYLLKLSTQEAKLQRKLYKVDSNATKNLFLSNPLQQYADYIQRIKTNSVFDPKKYSGDYLPYADSLQGSLSFYSNHFKLNKFINYA